MRTCLVSVSVSAYLLNDLSLTELAAGECRVAGCSIISTGTAGDCSLSPGITKACSGNTECTAGSTATRTGWNSSWDCHSFTDMRGGSQCFLLVNCVTHFHSSTVMTRWMNKQVFPHSVRDILIDDWNVKVWLMNYERKK